MVRDPVFGLVALIVGLVVSGGAIVAAVATGKVMDWSRGRGEPIRFIARTRDAPSYWLHIALWIIGFLFCLFVLVWMATKA